MNKIETKLTTREFYSKTYGCTMYMVSIVGGPQDLLARGTEAYALADGAVYAAERWGQTADGTWTPFRADWGQKFLTCRRAGDMGCETR